MARTIRTPGETTAINADVVQNVVPVTAAALQPSREGDPDWRSMTQAEALEALKSIPREKRRSVLCKEGWIAVERYQPPRSQE